MYRDNWAAHPAVVSESEATAYYGPTWREKASEYWLPTSGLFVNNAYLPYDSKYKRVYMRGSMAAILMRGPDNKFWWQLRAASRWAEIAAVRLAKEGWPPTARIRAICRLYNGEEWTGWRTVSGWLALLLGHKFHMHERSETALANDLDGRLLRRPTPECNTMVPVSRHPAGGQEVFLPYVVLARKSGTSLIRWNWRSDQSSDAAHVASRALDVAVALDKQEELAAERRGLEQSETGAPFAGNM